MRAGCGAQPYQCRPTLGGSASGSAGWNRWGPATRSCHGSRREQASTGNSGSSFIHLVAGRLHASGKHSGHQAGRTLEGPPAHLPQPRYSGRRSGRPNTLDFLPATSWRSTTHAASSRRRFLALVRRHRLPQPEVNVRIDEFVRGFPLAQIASRCGARRLGNPPDTFGASRPTDARDSAACACSGSRSLRFTWRQVDEERRDGCELAARSAGGPIWARSSPLVTSSGYPGRTRQFRPAPEDSVGGRT